MPASISGSVAMSQLVTVSSSHDTALTDADSSECEGTVNHGGNPRTRKRLIKFNSLMTNVCFTAVKKKAPEIKPRGFMFSPLSVCWLVGLSAGL